MIASGIGIAINVAMDSVIVYGFLGFPKWGIKGAAISTVIGSFVELVVLFVLARRAMAPVAMRRKDFVKPEKDLLKKFVRAAIPLMAQNQLWAAGVTVYSICFAYLGVEASAAYNVYGTLGELMNIVFISVGGAGGIMIGHILGAGEIERAKNYSWRLLRIIFISGILLAPICFFMKDLFLLPFPNLSDQTIAYARQGLMLISLVIWARGINFANMNGILRSGGDTLGAAAIDIGMLWLYGVPLALLVSYFLHLPFWVLFAVVCSEEVVKVFISIARVRKYKWAKRLV
jgi:Na+-driven multidrug efflux pump